LFLQNVIFKIKSPRREKMAEALNSPGRGKTEFDQTCPSFSFLTNVSHPGLFKEVEFSLTSEMDVRSASFHPIDPILACGLVQGGVVFLRGSNHTTPFEDWEIDPKHYKYRKTILSVQWNVSL
jgi:hypothetical protein